MEKRIGTVSILVSDRSQASIINNIISSYSDIILCRQGFPFHGKPTAVITLIVEGTVERINAMTGQIGRLPGVKSKAMLSQ